MNLSLVLFLGLMVACCVVLPWFLMRKHGSTKSAEKPGDGSNRS